MRFDRMITAVEAHAGGEPGRVITGGVIDVPGETMFAKMQYLQRASRRDSQAHAARAARLSRALLQHPAAADRSLRPTPAS